MIRTVCLSLVAVALLSLPSSASAYWGCYGGYGGCGGAWGNNYAYNYGVGYLPPPPYYAVFPPVYYSSHITMRHYGASPYAWPAGFSPTSFATRGPEPMLIINREMPPVEGAAPLPAAQAKNDGPQPLKINNPYVSIAAR
jgi:hypothetical protein